MSATKRGRPPVFTGSLEYRVVRAIKLYGITAGQARLATKGVQVSKPTLTRLAKRHGIVFTRGRPRHT